MPQWRQTIRLGDVFHNEDMTFEQTRDEVVRRLHQSGWAKSRADDFDFLNLIDELGDTDTPDYFDIVWDAIYDEADADRVWIDTHGQLSPSR